VVRSAQSIEDVSDPLVYREAPGKVGIRPRRFMVSGTNVSLRLGWRGIGLSFRLRETGTPPKRIQKGSLAGIIFRLLRGRRLSLLSVGRGSAEAGIGCDALRSSKGASSPQNLTRFCGRGSMARDWVGLRLTGRRRGLRRDARMSVLVELTRVGIGE
jgi:hypothetical protein